MEQVKAMLARLRTDYLLDLPYHIDEIEALILGLERNGFDLENCRELYRRIHNLKGSGGTYNLHVISDVCHPFEDLLSALLMNPDEFSHDFTSKAIAYIDLLRKIHIIYSKNHEPGSDVKQALLDLRLSTSKSLRSALIVENSDVVIGMLKDILQDHNFRIEVANDGYVSLGRLLAEPFDILITGLETKRLNGLALISAVQKSSGRINKTKTVLVTATQLTVGSDKPDFYIKKDAHLKESFKHVLTQLFAG